MTTYNTLYIYANTMNTMCHMAEVWANLSVYLDCIPWQRNSTKLIVLLLLPKLPNNVGLLLRIANYFLVCSLVRQWVMTKTLHNCPEL